ncbi:hypothetical protein ABZ345_06555 [Lentzea sp. NPDC005914]|uniref:hypothetical protein n=1 Tax=Lentzea sp. NPDC005914 TaxID=3154572 RepID=UPI0034109C20
MPARAAKRSPAAPRRAYADELSAVIDDDVENLGQLLRVAEVADSAGLMVDSPRLGEPTVLDAFLARYSF